MKFRKKPVVINAIQWTGGNLDEVIEFMRYDDMMLEKATWDELSKTITIFTLEGNMVASLYDWIIRGVHNEIYPCKPDIFEETYEKVS